MWHSYTRCNLVVNIKIIEQVMETEYLVIRLSSYGIIEGELQKQMNIANRAMEVASIQSGETNKRIPHSRIKN